MATGCIDRIVTTRAFVKSLVHSASQTVQICTNISIGSICWDVGTYEREGRRREGYNGIEGDCERGNTVIEDIFGTGDGWNFCRWISGTLISEMMGLMQELDWLQFVSKVLSLLLLYIISLV